MANHIFRFTTLLAGVLIAASFTSAKAQSGDERYYLYQASGITTPQREKQLTELLRGFDGDMVVSLDVPTQRLKLVTTSQLSETEVIAVAGQVGVALVRIPMHTIGTVAPSMK
ncbi:MAG: hypothetical protein ABI599_12815 [Flavobacteriales bacterium]